MCIFAPKIGIKYFILAQILFFCRLVGFAQQNRARMEIRHPRPILLGKYPKIKKFEFEPENNRISALHFLHLNCIISV